MTQYQYKIERMEGMIDKEIMQALDLEGKNGWEAWAMEKFESGTLFRKTVCIIYFKRKIENQ